MIESNAFGLRIHSINSINKWKIGVRRGTNQNERSEQRPRWPTRRRKQITSDLIKRVCDGLDYIVL